MRKLPEHRNNFDLLRFLLAATVVLFHLAVLSKMPALASLLAVANGTYGVLGFFAISGYVVTLSWYRCAGWREYVERRARRILPGYLAVVLFWWFAGSMISTLSAPEYWQNAGTWRYLAANVSFLQFFAPSLPGVFAGDPRLPAVNGSLWSIRSELLCYLLLPFAVRRQWPGIIALVSGAAGTALALNGGGDPHIDQLRIGLANPLTCFFLGTWLTQRKSVVAFKALGLVALAGFGLLLYQAWNPLPAQLGSIWQGLVMPAAVSAAVLGAGLSGSYVGKWGVLGNLSYGMYLWHFPIIQFALSTGWFQASPAAWAGFCIALTAAAASLSWYCVERRLLLGARPAYVPPPANQPAILG
jgi:peptidoglycan/LPS O-acetylase OafA/YrhL